ncbi:MAG: LytTR family transcriptional regulator DNA-binding domain-containing protein [Clostridiales bacterium]|nr:LytTR family transcriptional regulator DNA-binding domain-containing protein [Clostridiales bacterium]
MRVHKYQDANLPEDYVDIHYREQNSQINGLFRYLEALDSIHGKNDQGIRVIPVSDVYFFETVDRKTWAYLEKDVYEVEPGIHKILEEFSGKGLVQISRSMCVNVFKIDYIQADLNMRYKIFLTNGETVIMNRSFKKDFFSYLDHLTERRDRLLKLFQRSSRKEKKFLYLSYAANVFLLSIVLMIVKLLAETSFDLSESDAEQSAMMALGVIFVAVVIIAFFLWLIAMEFKGLYDSRVIFNRNVRLMGFPGRKLMTLYLLEMFDMQVPCVAGGGFLGIVVYHFYAMRNSEEILWMEPGILIAAIVIHLCMLMLTFTFVGRKCAGQSAVTEQRGSQGVKRVRRKKWGTKRERQSVVVKQRRTGRAIICLGIAAAMGIVIRIICHQFWNIFDATDALRYSQAVKLAYLAVVAAGFGPVMRLVFRIAEAIGKRFGAMHFSFSLMLAKSFWGRFLIMSFLMIFSGAFFCGLYTLFETTRSACDILARESIHYQSYYIYDQLYYYDDPLYSVNQSEEELGAFYTFRYRALMEDGGHIWVTGITGEYLGRYETFQTTEVAENGKSPDLITEYPELAELLDNEDFDGIIMDETFANRMGENIVLNVNGTDITFTIYAAVLSHDNDRLDAYVSRSYLEKQLGAENLYNTIYYMETPATVDTDHVFLSQTNEEIWEENWQHIVQGTETMELIFWVILICSMFAICTCLVMSGEDNRRNLAYLRGIGAGKGMLLKMYLFQAIWNVACTILPVTFLTWIFAKGIGYLLMNPGYYGGSFAIDVKKIMLLFGAYFLVSASVQALMVRKTAGSGRYVEVLRG